VKIEHDFNNNVKLTNITRYNLVDRLQRNVFPEPNTAAVGSAAAEPELVLDPEPGAGLRQQHAVRQPDRHSRNSRLARSITR
jgi:hypothetical protein